MSTSSFYCCVVVAATFLLNRREATEGSTVLTTKELPSLLDNHVSITEAVFKVKAFLSAVASSKCFPSIQLAKMLKLLTPPRRFIPVVTAGSKCFPSIQLAKMLKLLTPPRRFIPVVTAGSDCISDTHYSIY